MELLVSEAPVLARGLSTPQEEKSGTLVPMMLWKSDAIRYVLSTD